MNHNKPIAIGLILTLGLFLTTGCIGGETGTGPTGTGEGPGGKFIKPIQKTTEGQPITNCQELQNINENLSANYYLANDIDCSETKNWNDGEGFKPIGNKDNTFRGSLNGNGYIVKNLYINRNNEDDVGLFSYTGSNADIKNIGLENININGDADVGGLIGTSDGNVINSYAVGSVTGEDYGVGGLIGDNRGSLSGSYATGSVTGSSNGAGGLIGYNWGGSVSDSYSTGSVTGNNEVGGLIGENRGSLSGSYATGNVTGSGGNVGGLIGGNGYWGSVSDSYSTGSVTGNNEVGGLVGDNFGSVSNSYATGNVNGVDWVGGLIGDNYKSSVSNSFWDTETSGTEKSEGGTGLSTSEMQTKTTFTDAGWDFEDVWYMDGYPHLQWEK